MGKRRIRKRLKRYARACEGIVPENKEAGIQKLLQAQEVEDGCSDAGICIQKKPDVRTRGTLYHFILEQTGYVGRYCLFWQGLWIVAFFYLTQSGITQFVGGAKESGVLVAISLLAPLLVLLTVEEITKVYQKSMLEIEYATKYSLRSVVMSRMAISGIFHCVILAVCTLCLPGQAAFGAVRLMVYGFTPMVIMAGVLMKLMQYFQGEKLSVVALGAYVFAVALMTAGGGKYFGWYQPPCFKVWCAAGAVGNAFMARQLICLHRKLSGFERIVRYGMV